MHYREVHVGLRVTFFNIFNFITFYMDSQQTFPNTENMYGKMECEIDTSILNEVRSIYKSKKVKKHE